MGIIGKTLRFVGGLALGAGVGAAAAMLLAPQSGETSKDQLQARVDEVLTAGRRASRARETELYAAWEAEMGDEPGSKPKRPAQADDDEAARQREKARAAATKAEDEAREKARKELEQAQDEAQKHLDKARAELEKAEKAEKS